MSWSLVRGWRRLVIRLGPARLARLASGILLFLFLLFRVADPLPLANMRHELFDWYQRLVPREPGEDPVVVVDIDEASLEELGQWPWPRTLLARLIERLLAEGADAVALDIILAEPDRSSPPVLTRLLTDLPRDVRQVLGALPDHDTRLAAVIAGQPVALGSPALLQPPARSTPAAPAPPTPLALLGDDPRAWLPSYPARLRNLPALEQAAMAIGIVTLMPEPDGSVRRLPLAAVLGGEVRLVLGVEAVRLARRASPVILRTDAAGVASLQLGSRIVPTDELGRVWVHFAGRTQRPTVPARDVLADTVAPGLLAGRVVLIGASAAGLGDLRPTPLDAAMPGVHVHAELIENILDDATLMRPGYALGLELGAALLTGAFIIALAPSLGAVPMLLLGGVVILPVIGGAWLLYLLAGWLLDPLFAALTGLAVWGLMVCLIYLAEVWARREADRQLQLIRQEGELAGRVQQSMLPSRFPSGSRFELFGAMHPARDVGGDFFETMLLPDGRLSLAVADVCGKGMPAALLMAVSRTMLRTNLLAGGGDSGQVLGLTNTLLAADNESMLFVTLFHAILDCDADELVCSNAGHNPPILLSHDGSAREITIPSGPALGVMEDLDYPTTRLPLRHGDTFFLYTDGVVEAFSETDEEYGLQRLLAVLGGAQSLRPHELVDRVIEDVRRFAGRAPQSDDITCLALRLVEPRVPAS